MLEEPPHPKHILGWVLLAIACVPIIGYSVFLHVQEEKEWAAEQEIPRWETNWSQLKIGMSKEQVLALVGAPSSTNVMDTQITSASSTPADPNLERSLQHILDQKMNFAVWSYYGSMVVHTTPGEDGKTAMAPIWNQEVIQMTNGWDGKLHGHAIKFDGTGRIVEISSP